MKFHSILSESFKLDGGAMFGVVPKTLWQKTNPADVNNRIEICSRSLLIEDGNRLILIDTGMGNKQSEKFFNYYGRSHCEGLDVSLNKKGFHRDDITDVFLTHLHFDHCGGAIIRTKSGLLEPSFKNAVFWSHEGHWKWATQPNPREKASFLKENIIPIKESGKLNLIKGEGFLIENTPLNFDIILVNGHTEKQMLPVLKYQEKTLVFVADLIPTVGHLPIPYVMGYDTRPLITMEEKSRFLKLAVEKNFLLFLEHDPNNELITLKQSEKGVRMSEKHVLTDFF